MFAEGGPAGRIANLVRVRDIDSANLAGGVLTVSLTNNSEATDVLSIVTLGVGLDAVSTNGSNVLVGGVHIGTYAGGTNQVPLTVSFNANATPSRTQLLLRAIGFSSTSLGPSTLFRTVQFVLTDGDGGTSTPVTKLIGVVATNDAPVVVLPTSAISYSENAAGLLVFSGATAVDLDAPVTPSAIVLTISNTNGESSDRLQFLPSGVYTVVGNELRANGVAIATIAGGVGTTPLVITFNSNMARVQAVLNLIRFFSVSESPSTILAFYRCKLQIDLMRRVRLC